MPKGDRNGPSGQGPQTGRATGYCAGFAGPGYVNSFAGRGFGGGYGPGRGRGGGMGRGMANRWRAPAPIYPYSVPNSVPYSAQDEAETLRRQAQQLDTSLEDIGKRLAQLEETPEEST